MTFAARKPNLLPLRVAPNLSRVDRHRGFPHDAATCDRSGQRKGGAGKSTLAIHIVTGLLHAGRTVAIIDLDLRQRSMQRFFTNRLSWVEANGHTLPQPMIPDMGDGKALAKASVDEQIIAFERAFDEAVAQGVECILIDTPGGDTAVSSAAHARADQIVTPMNDSFVDFDLWARWIRCRWSC